MFNDADHPNVTLPEWKGFKVSETARQGHIAQVVDRRDCGFFPDWYVPLARGVAIAGPALLREAGYDDGMRRPRNWITHWTPTVTRCARGYTKGADRSNFLSFDDAISMNGG